MTTHPITSAGVCAAIEKIRFPRNAYDMQRTFSKVRLLTHLAKYDKAENPLEKGLETIAEQMGMSVDVVRNRLQDLVDQRVLLRESAAGSRAHSYLIEPDIRRWRAFEWAVPVSLVDAEVGFATGEYKVEKPRLSTRVYNSRQHKFIERPIDPRTKSRLSTSPKTSGQSKVASGNSPGRAVDNSVASFNNSTSVETKLAISSEQSEVLNKIKAAYVKRLQLKFLRGKPEQLLAELVVAGATAEELLELVMRMPPEKEVLSGVEWMITEWHGRDVDIEPAEVQAERDERDILDAEISALNTQIANWRGIEGLEDDVMDLEIRLGELEKLRSEKVNVFVKSPPVAAQTETFELRDVDDTLPDEFDEIDFPVEG